MKHRQNHLLQQTTSQIQKILPTKISKKKQNRINKQIRLFQSLAQVYLQKRNFPQSIQTLIGDKSKTGRYFKDKNMQQQKNCNTRRYLRSQNKSLIKNMKQKIRNIYLPNRNRQVKTYRQNNNQKSFQKIEKLKTFVNTKAEDKNNFQIQITKKNQQTTTDKEIQIKKNQRRIELKSSLEQYRNCKNRYKKQQIRPLHSTMNSRSYIVQKQKSKSKLNSVQSNQQIQIPFSPQSIVFKKKQKDQSKKQQKKGQNKQIETKNCDKILKRRSICYNNKNVQQIANKQSQQNYQEQLKQQKQSQNRQSKKNRQQFKSDFQLVQAKKKVNNPCFIFQSEDNYIRKWLELNKWKQCSKNYDKFKLKWSYKECLTDYNVLNQKQLNSQHMKMQYYNHIKNNKILSKEGLNQIFHQMQLLQLSPHRFIPRSYSLTKNINEFEEDYFLGCVLGALKKSIKNLKSKELQTQIDQQTQMNQIQYSAVQQFQQVQKATNQIQQYQKMQITLKQLLTKLNLIKNNQFVNQLERKTIQKFKHVQNQSNNFAKTQFSKESSKRSNFNFSFTVIVFLCILLQIQINKKEGAYENFQIQFTSLLALQSKKLIIQFLQDYFKTANHSMNQNIQYETRRIINSYSFLRRIQSLYGSQGLSLQFKYEFVKLLEQYYFFFLKKQKIKFKAEGDDNIWIIKPMHGSRGIGIQILNNYKKTKKIIQTRPHSKIIQKYIQNVWILDPQKVKKSIDSLKKKKVQNKNKKIQHIIKLYKSPIFLKKFDIRQWVLLNPPKSYIFSKFYLKICSEQYQVKGSSIQSHLSNYSVNKNVFIQNNDQADSILSEDQFYQVLKLVNYSVEKIQSIRNNMKDRISKILQINRQFLDPSEGCFQLIGFDIILDNELNPWVIQANMSPACSQRSEWLQQMKKQMANKMFQIIFEKDNELKNLIKYQTQKEQINLKKEQFCFNRKNLFQWNQIQFNTQQLLFYNKKCFDKIYLQVIGKKQKLRKLKEQKSKRKQDQKDQIKS